MKILIVDDDESLSSIITTALEKEGFNTLYAKTGRDAINKARSDAPDLILLDQVLPDISGNQVLKELKLDEFRQHVEEYRKKLQERDRALVFEKSDRNNQIIARYKPQLKKLERLITGKQT